MAPPQLLWEVVKGHNSFLRKNLNHTTFSAEPFNLYNKSSYKYSGIANAKAVDVSADGASLKVSKKRTKASQQPAKAADSVVFKKKSGRRALKSIAKEVASYRPDLKAAAVARASAVLKSLRVQKGAAN